MDPKGAAVVGEGMKPMRPPRFKLQVEKDVSMILDHVFLGAKAVSEDREALERLGVSYVVNCTKDQPNHFQQDGMQYLQVGVVDHPTADISPYFEGTGNFIEEARRAKAKVLVHCTMGMSRSSTIVIAYLMKHNGMDLSCAVGHTKERRPVASPNTGFMRQLINYERSLYGRTTISLDHYQADRFGDVSAFRIGYSDEDDEAAARGGACDEMKDVR